MRERGEDRWTMMMVSCGAADGVRAARRERERDRALLLSNSGLNLTARVPRGGVPT